MADLALNERLQPALLDRLIDDERIVALVGVVAEIAALERLKLPEQALIDILTGQGMACNSASPQAISSNFVSQHRVRMPTRPVACAADPSSGRTGRSSTAIIRDGAVRIGTESRARAGRPPDAVDAQLRECVLRDLGWLFNSLNLESYQDLDSVPQVASSVLNYGLPSFAGRMASSIDPLESASACAEQSSCSSRG